MTLGALTATFDGSAKPVSVATIPPGLSTSVTYNGNSTAPFNAGTYAVLTTVTQPGYSGLAGGTYTIDKASAIVTLGTISFTYDGSAKSVTVTTNPAGRAVTVTYNGSATAPSAVGNYTVVATISDPNYQGSAVGSMTISASQADSVPALGIWGVMAMVVMLAGYLSLRRRHS